MDDVVARVEHDEMKLRFEERFDRVEARVGDLEGQVRDITKSMLSIQRIELVLESIQEDNKRMMKRLEELEREPADKWRKMVWYVMTAIAGGVIALILRQVGI